MKRDVLHSPRLSELKKRRRRVVINKILLLVFCFALIFTLSTYLSRLPNLNIAEIQVVGNKVVDTDAIKKVAQEQIAGKYAWLFPKTNILFYPKNNIIHALRKNFTRLQDITLSVKQNKILEITIIERVPKYTWCGAVTPELNSNSNQKCYFMDDSGYIFDEAPFFSGQVYFKFYGFTDIPNQEPLSASFAKGIFSKLIGFKDVLIAMGLKPVAIYLTNTGDAEVFLASAPGSSSQPWIFVKANADFQSVAENLQTALTTEPLQSKLKTKYSSLMYIDLRYGNKVFYKFQ